ncbi:hypothetical protein [Candidatus Pelagibacter ubique]|uniref:hypothetical protein n=1 Tax=Pelagibacter ubique TaxID=198252 RepID=UPI0003C7F517
MINYLKKNKEKILNLSLKKIYRHFFLNNITPTGYYSYLKDLIFEFLQSKYPSYKKEDFEEKIDKLISEADDYRNLNDELNVLFNPRFNEDLEFHYKYQESYIFFRFITYSMNIKLISDKYAQVYNFAINNLNQPLDILEIGGGLPHGLIYNVWKKNKTFLENFTYVDANLLHSEFVKWYCKKIKIVHDIKLFRSSKTPILENRKFNFVFAKDIFEHLDAPEILIDFLISNTKNDKTLLCLDLEHKGEKTVQHISPNLPVLKDRLIKNNFKVIKEFKEIHVWKKIN